MLKVQNLTKKFAGKDALKGISFEVNRGEIYGLLGHNGAGKSTTLGIILSMVGAESGEVFIGGVSVRKNPQQALCKVGSIFEAPWALIHAHSCGLCAPWGLQFLRTLGCELVYTHAEYIIHGGLNF